jgi:competence protein ComEC
MLLIYLSCAWVAGIWLGYYLDLPPAFALAGLLPFLGLFLTRTRRRLLVVSGLAIIIFVAAAAYSYASLYGIDEGKISFYNDRGVTEIKGTIAEDPDVRDTSARLTVAVREIKLEDRWREASGKMLVVVPRYPEYRYGDFLRLTGAPETPEISGDFDYRGYLAHQGIATVMYYPGIGVLDTGRGFAPLAWLYSLRGKLSNVLAEVLPEPQAALAQGIVLGIRSNIPADLTMTSR